MKRVVRDRLLTPDEVAKFRKIRELIAAELLSIIERHHEREARKRGDQ